MDEDPYHRYSGALSCQRLRESLSRRFGDSVQVDRDSEADAIGWRFLAKPRLLFSVSTAAGTLPTDRFDLQVSVIDDSLENGEIVFGPDAGLLTIDEVLIVSAKLLLE